MRKVRSAHLATCAIVFAACSLTATQSHSRTLPWAFPLTKPSNVTAIYGAFQFGCRNADRSASHLNYDDPRSNADDRGTKAHLGLDLKAAAGDDVIAVADGMVLEAKQLWGSANKDVMLITHMTTDGEIVTVVYGHISIGENPNTGKKWQYGDMVRIGNKLGVVASMPNAHLHIGIAEGSRKDPKGMGDARLDNKGNCEVRPDGTIDPMVFFTQNYYMATIPGNIVSGKGSTSQSSSVVNWYVNYEKGNFIRYQIPNNSQHRCIKGYGALDWGIMPERFLGQFYNQDSRVAATCK